MSTTRREWLQTMAALSAGAVADALIPRWVLPQQPDRLAAFRAQFGAVPIQTQSLGENLTMLSGPGGNVVVLRDPGGLIVIDTFVAPAWPKLEDTLKSFGSRVKVVINTHWHFDHTGGNENFGGAGAAIVAHENVRKRMSADGAIDFLGMKFTAAPRAALPAITFTRDTVFNVNGDELHVVHAANAHTDGDAIVHFRKSNVIHMGDTFFNGRYPLIDLSSGGSIDGMVGAADRVLAVADANTKIIPGHGPLGDRAALQTYRTMLATIRDRIRQAVAAGRTLEQVQAAKPTAEFDAVWGNGRITPTLFVEMLYTDLAARRRS